MKEKLCCWISDFGHHCKRKIRVPSPRIIDLYNGKRGYLCKSHQKTNNNRKDYKRNKNKRLEKQKKDRSTPEFIVKQKKRSTRRYFTREGHPFFVWNAAKNYWSKQIGQKFKLTHRQAITLHVNNYNRLFTAWEKAGFQEKLTPMITKLHFKKEYSKYNFRWITFGVAGYNPSYMKDLLGKATTYRKNLLKRSKEAREARGGSTGYEFL